MWSHGCDGLVYGTLNDSFEFGVVIIRCHPSQYVPSPTQHLAGISIDLLSTACSFPNHDALCVHHPGER